MTTTAESQGKTDVLNALEVASQLSDGTFLDNFKKQGDAESKQLEEDEMSIGSKTLVLGEENFSQDSVAIFLLSCFFQTWVESVSSETKSYP